MGSAYILRRGGAGSAALNFKIVGGTVQPSNPSENTIWIDTSVSITEWYFSADAPENPAEGALWIVVGTISNVKFNALKKNNIMVYPSAALQCIAGEWVQKTATIYINGQWMAWTLYLISNGFAQVELSTYNMSYTEQAGGMTIEGTSSGLPAIWAECDLTGRTTIVIAGDFYISSGEGSYYTLAVCDTSVERPSISNALASAQLTASGATLDVSALSGVCKVGITSVGVSKHTVVDLYLI